MVERRRRPEWLERLTAEESFFGGCGDHQQRRKNEKNIFCLLCCHSFCPHCLPSHPSHPLLQVRRYVYQDVIRLDDLEKLIDCSYIQPYTINRAKVIFLKERGPSGSSCKGSANSCFTCNRILQLPFTFCSLSCKVDFMVYNDQDLSGTVHKFDASEMAATQLEGLRMDGSDSQDAADGEITPNSILEDPLMDSSSCSNNNDMGISGISHAPEEAANSRNKNSSGFLPAGITMLSLTNRRKGAPSRSPLS